MSDAWFETPIPQLSRRRLLSLTAAGAASLALSGSLLAACGSDDEEATEEPQSSGGSAGTPTGSDNTSSTSGTEQENAAPTNSAAAGNATETFSAVPIANMPEQFIVANDNEPGNLLPGWGGGFGPAMVLRAIYQPLFEPRITISEANIVSVEMMPVLATGYEQVDDLRWRYTLREDVVFHNGEPFNAEAVKIAFDLQTDDDFLAQYDLSNTIGQALAGCEIVDDMTVDFVAVRPDSEIPNSRLRGLLFVPPMLLQEQGFEPFFENPVGTGAYRFESWTRGQDIQLVKFEDYWDPNGPNMPAVRFIVRPEAAVRAQTVQTGEAHLAYSIGGELAATLDHSVVGGGFQSSGIRMNNTIEPTNNYNLRRAINLAVDRQGIIDSIFLGAAVPLAFFGFQPIELEPFPYDPDQAAQIIQDEGLEGTELELIYGENRIPEEPQLAEVYVAQLSAIGLNVTLNRMEPRQYNEVSGDEFTNQPPLLMETTSSGNSGEIASGLRDKYGCEGSGTFCDPAYDEEFNELAALTGDEKNAKLQSIAERLHNEHASRVWVAAVQQVHGIAENVETDFAANTYVFMDKIKFA